MDILALIFAAAALLLVVLFLLAPRRELKTEIWIDASREAVWTHLATPLRYADWNPFLVSMKGDLVEGSRLTNTMRPASGKEMTFSPTVLTVSPQRELRWLGRLFLPRLFDGEHYFLLEDSDGGTRLVHGEKFHGVLLWFIDVQTFLPDFEALNRALKTRSEALPPRAG